MHRCVLVSRLWKIVMSNTPCPCRSMILMSICILIVGLHICSSKQLIMH